MERNPHQLIEGMVIAAFAIEADDGVHLPAVGIPEVRPDHDRGPARGIRSRVLWERTLPARDSALEMRVHTSAGRYICGEETALLNALEGKRAIPRAKPPFPQSHGLWGKPTIVNNVETLCNVPHIVKNGPAWFKGLEPLGDGGTKIYR